MWSNVFWSAVYILGTQGVLACKFPISIWTQIQGQHGCQIFRKIVYNYVPISDFATRSLNLRNPEIFAKKYLFSLKKRQIKGALFRCTFCPYSIFVLKKIFFWPNICHRNKCNCKMGPWWQNLRLAHESTLFSWIFDTYVDPGSAFI